MNGNIEEQSAHYDLADLTPVFEKASGNNTLLDNLNVWLSAQTTKSSGRGRSAKNTHQYGVQKLRELILELAVRGKLDEQDPNDESTSVLLEKIAEEKVRLLKEGKIKKQKKLPVIHENEKPYTLPSTWSWTRLGHVTDYGITDKAEPNSTHEDCWVLELEDIEKGSSKLLQKVLKSERQFKSSKNKFSAGDVLYGKLRPYLDKVLIASDDGVCTTEIIPFKGYANINSAYIRLVMKSPRFIAYANDSTHGMNLPRLGTDNARMAVMPLPPIAEQHRIVKKVDELMALCDQLEQQQTDAVQAHDTLVKVLLDTLTQSENADDFQQTWRRIAEHFDTLFNTESSIDQLKQTLLQLAVMGKLVPQDPTDEPASILLEKVAEERTLLIKGGELKKQKPLPEITQDEISFSLPDGWSWSRFGDTFTLDYGNNLPQSKRTNTGEYPVYGSNGVVGTHYESCIDKPCIVIGRKGSAGALNLCKHDGCWVTDVAYSSVPPKGIDLNFAFKLFHTLGLDNLGKGIKPGLNRNEAYLLPIAVPPLAEQQRIVKKVDELMALCDRLRDRFNQAQTLQQQLADAVVETAITED